MGIINIRIVSLQHIRRECKHNNILSVRLIFGATPLTPKEIYVVKLPKVSKQHSVDNHLKSVTTATNKVLMWDEVQIFGE